MKAGEAKKKVLEVIEELPFDAAVEDANERLYFLAKVEKGLQQVAEGQTISHKDAKNRLLGG
ncbi:MAG: hypothetical protein HYX92_04560 [Chloroflexi bacterium]|nr:hypothetical protein [Chloroflexota bacterium]